MVNDLDYEGVKFPVFQKDYCKIEQKNNICINVFCYKILFGIGSKVQQWVIFMIFI